MKNLLKDLDSAQIEAVKQTDGPVLILAGAGSGKTRVLTYKVAYLISQGEKPENILAVTFTNKAANEMKERITKLLVRHSSSIAKKSSNDKRSSIHDLPFVGTFHAFCARLLRIDGKYIGIPNGYLIYDDDDSLSLVKRIMKDNDISTKNFRPSSILSAISSAKSELLSPNDYAQFAHGFFAETVSQVYTIYQKELKAQNACDFDDLLMLTVSLFKMNPIVLQKWARRFKYVLVDEYQDVNKAQFVITRLLAGHAGNLTAVGDAAQAIYSFRGADFRNLTLLEKEYPDLVTLRLPKNYRSTQTILDAAYGVIANNKNHPVLKLEAIKSFGEKIEMVEVVDEREEAAYVVSIAERLSAAGGSLAVLYRTNAQSRAIEEALIRRKIDYKLVGGIRFYDRAEIKDLLAYLRVIYNSEDLVSWQRVEGLGKRNKAKFEIWLASERGRLLEKYPHELLSEIIDQTAYLARFNERDEDDAARVENIKELLAVASEQPDLTAFLTSVALIQSEEIAERKAGKALVTMMTIHAAKGLEFDEVIIVGLEEGLLPHSRSLLEREDLEEERRLMYVAMTRARAKLHLTLTRSRLVYGGRQVAAPSRFLAEIPQELLKIASRGFTTYRELTPKTITNEDFVEERRIVSDWETEPTSLKLRWEDYISEVIFVLPK